MTAANLGMGLAASASRSAMPPSRGMPAAGEPPVGVALGAVLQVQAAGFDVPVPGGDEPARRQHALAGADLPAQRGDRVLQFQGGGPADARDRDRLGRARPGPVRPAGGAWASGCALLVRLPLQDLHDGAGLPGVDFPGAFPGDDPILNRTLIPSGRSPSGRL